MSINCAIIMSLAPSETTREACLPHTTVHITIQKSLEAALSEGQAEPFHHPGTPLNAVMSEEERKCQKVTHPEMLHSAW